MKQKLIFLDIDGTLTEAGKNVPPVSAQNAVAQARKNGHRVVLCTGRNYEMLSPLLPYGFDGFICCAGGYIRYGDEVIYDCPMTEEQREKSLTTLEKCGVYRTVETCNHTYTDESFKNFLAQHADEGANSELLRWREQLEHCLDIRPMAQYQGEPIYKIVFMCCNRSDLDEPMRILGDEFEFCVQDADRFGFINGELINKKFNKGMAVLKLAKYLNIPVEDTIAFGDSMNDREMIETVALGICMGNGSPTLKELADEVCPPVGEDGLYRAFEAHGLI